MSLGASLGLLTARRHAPGLMGLVILLALAASFCTATASVCQRAGARSSEITGFDVWLIFRASPSGGRRHAPGSVWWLAALITLGIVLLVLGLAFGPGGRPGASRSRRAALLGAATGISWGFVAALIKELSSHLGDGIGAVFSNWSPYVLVVVGAASPVSRSSAAATSSSGTGRQPDTKHAAADAEEDALFGRASAAMMTQATRSPGPGGSFRRCRVGGLECGAHAANLCRSAKVTDAARSPNAAIEVHGHRCVGMRPNAHRNRGLPQVWQGRMPRASEHMKRVQAGRELHPEASVGTGMDDSRNTWPAPPSHDR